MKMYARFMMMMIMVTMFLLVIFTHIDSHVGTRPINIYDDLTRQEPIELARDAEGESPAYNTAQTIIKAKDKHEGKERHDKSEKHKIENDTNKGPIKRSLENEDNKLVLVTHETEEALKNLEYPDWWTKAWSQSATSGQGHIFVGDKPLFPPCTQDVSQTPSGKIYQMEEPRNYIKETKNPCWYDKPDQKRGLCCLPYFYIAGVAKCGTTDMNYRLMLHPDVLKGSMKEYHWWDRYRFEALAEGSEKKRRTGKRPRVIQSIHADDHWNKRDTGAG